MSQTQSQTKTQTQLVPLTFFIAFLDISSHFQNCLSGALAIAAPEKDFG